MARYLVTGGCGFIGSHLVDSLLAAGDEVVILDDLSSGKIENVPGSVPVAVGTVTDTSLVREMVADVDGCFHLAAIASVQKSNEDWQGTHRVNLTGAVNIFDAVRRRRKGRQIPVVYASSAAVYGDNPSLPLDENAVPRPITAYGADKLACEHHARVATRIHGVPTVGFRFFNVYGPRQDPHSPYSGVISIFSTRIAEKRPLYIFGDGCQVRDFVFVSDVVRYLMAAMANPPPNHEVFNICSGIASSITTLTHILSDIAGHEAQVTYLPERPGDVRASVGSNGKAKRAFGFTPTVSLSQGLEATLMSLGMPTLSATGSVI